LHLIEQWPGAAGRVQRISCQLFGSSRLCADSPRHRQAIVPPRGFVTDHPHPYPGRCKGASCAIRSARPGRCAASISSKQYPMRGQDWTRIGGWNWKRFDTEWNSASCQDVPRSADPRQADADRGTRRMGERPQQEALEGTSTNARIKLTRLYPAI
jgi:hypothetical protein